MTSFRNDICLWIGLGVFSFVAYRTIQSQLQTVRNVTEVPPEPKQPRVVSQETEDALELDTLCNLVEGSSPELRSAAIKILYERATAGPAFDLLLNDVISRNVDHKFAALTTLKVLSESQVAHKINHVRTYAALVSSLVQELATTSNPHAPSERAVLSILNQLLPYNVSDALKGGIVKRWLARYPFGSTELARRATVQRYKGFKAGDALMSEIICYIDQNAEGRKQMRQAGLLGSAMDEGDGDDILMIGGEDTAGEAPDQSNSGNRRLREESEEEQALRRRRREAMVFSEGGRPLGRDDIIQPRQDNHEDDLEIHDEVLGELVVRNHSFDGDVNPDNDSDIHTIPYSWSTWRPWRSREREN